MASVGMQNPLRLSFGAHHAAKDAPGSLLRQIDSEAQALAVAMAAGHFKCAYIGACIGKSEGYVSRLRAGKRPIPDRLVGPLCAATGSNLLRQYRDWQDALNETSERRHIERLAARLVAA